MLGRWVMLIAVGLLGGLAGCGKSDDAPAAGKPRVAATTTMIGDLVRQIAGDRVHLDTIIGPGVDPHTFKPSTSDLGKLSQADRVFYNGLHLEGKMIELFEEKLKDRAIAVAAKVPENKLQPWQQGQGGAHDPHIWFDVKLWMIAAEAVRDGLISLDPAGTAEYQAKADALLSQMTELDDYVRRKVQEIPAGRRMLVTSHDAYNYFGVAYGMQVYGLQGISTESEAGVANINQAVETILKYKIPAIFVESSVSHATIERVQADCKARGFEVAIGGELFSDAMGAPGQHPPYVVETYDGMVRYNVDTVANALKK